MKITKTQLKKLIKEELERVLNEDGDPRSLEGLSDKVDNTRRLILKPLEAGKITEKSIQQWEKVYHSLDSTRKALEKRGTPATPDMLARIILYRVLNHDLQPDGEYERELLAFDRAQAGRGTYPEYTPNNINVEAIFDDIENFKKEAAKYKDKPF